MNDHHPLSFLFAASLAACSLIAVTKADSITAIAHGSLSDAAMWSNGEMPTASHDYALGNYNLTVAPPPANATFLGGSLTLGNGRGTVGLKVKKFTVPDLRLVGNGGAMIQSWRNDPVELAGAITISTYGIISPSEPARHILVSASISGTGLLSVRRGTVELTNGENSYGKGTEILADGHLLASGDGVLGSGNVVVASKGRLTLTGGTENNYIDDAAVLRLAPDLADGSVTLKFDGTDVIRRLSLDAGATWAPSGTYGSPESSAQFKLPVFTGPGILQVGASVAPR